MTGEDLGEAKIRRSLEDEQKIYDNYLRVLGLSDEALEKIRSICDIGSGANAFASAIKRRHPHVFVLGIDPAEKNYHLSDPASINHSANSIGIPDDAPKFDLVVSVNAFPAYHELAAPPRDTIKAEAEKRHDYTFVDALGAKSGVELQIDAIETLSEMLRLTKVGGKVICHPVLVTRDSVFPSLSQVNEAVTASFNDGVLASLKERYPKYGYKLIVDVPATQQIRGREISRGERVSDTLKCRLEITKRRT